MENDRSRIICESLGGLSGIKMKLLLLTPLVIVTVAAFGQRTVEGQIKLKNDSSSLAGVNVVERGTDNRTNSDGAGRFTITCSSSRPILQFSFIGCKTIEAAVEGSYLTVYLVEDEDVLNEKIRFGMYPEYTSIGFNSGVNYTPIGINVRNAIPVLLGIKMLTTTEISYRTDLHENEFIDINVKKEQLINTRYYGRYINVNLGYNRRKISDGLGFFESNELTIAPELRYDSFIFLLGYGGQSFGDVETLKSNQGLIFGLGKDFKWNGRLVGIAKKWNHYWQSDFQFTKGFERNDFEFGIGLETLGRFKELDLLMVYRIHY